MNDSASRIEDVVDLLAKLASGELGARGNRSELGDDLDAVIEGVNMLAEELEASRFPSSRSECGRAPPH